MKYQKMLYKNNISVLCTAYSLKIEFFNPENTLEIICVLVYQDNWHVRYLVVICNLLSCYFLKQLVSFHILIWKIKTEELSLHTNLSRCRFSKLHFDNSKPNGITLNSEHLYATPFAMSCHNIDDNFLFDPSSTSMHFHDFIWYNTTTCLLNLSLNCENRKLNTK